MSIHLCFFFNDTATTEIYTLSLHDALPIWAQGRRHRGHPVRARVPRGPRPRAVRRARRRGRRDRKSTRLNSSHANISYAVFCLKKKKKSQFPRDVYRSRNTNTHLSSTLYTS